MLGLAENHKIGSAAFDALGLVGGGDAGREGLNQRLERRAVSVLGGIPGLQLSLDLSAVNVYRTGGHESLLEKIGSGMIVTTRETGGQSTNLAHYTIPHLLGQRGAGHTTAFESVNSG